MILAERERPFWGFAEVFFAVAAFVVAIVAAGLVVGQLADAFHLNPQSGFLLVLAEFLGYAVLFFALKLLFLRHDKPLLASLGWIRQPSFRPLHLVITGFLLAVAMVLLGWILQTPDIQTPFEKLLNDQLSRIVIALFGITLGPVVEELLFRGFLQPVLVDHFGALPGILATSILFGGMHLIQNANIWQSGVVIAIVGFVLGVIRHISGSTRASALTHIAYNSLPFLALLADTGKHT